MGVIFYTNAIHYSGFDATAEPSIADQVATMSGGETSGPLYDLLDNRRTNTLSVDTNGETQDFTIQIELTSSIVADYIIIDNHNLNTAEALYIAAYSATPIAPDSSYSGSYGTETSADTISGIGDTAVTPAADGITVTNFSDQTDDTWQIAFDDVDTFDADCTMGEISIGNQRETTFNPELQPVFSYDMPGSSLRESGGGQRYGFSTHENKRRGWRFNWKHMTDGDKSNLEEVFLYQSGIKNPFYIDLSGPLGNTNPTLFYVRFTGPLNFKKLTENAWALDLMLEEEI